MEDAECTPGKCLRVLCLEETTVVKESKDVVDVEKVSEKKTNEEKEVKKEVEVLVEILAIEP